MTTFAGFDSATTMCGARLDDTLEPALRPALALVERVIPNAVFVSVSWTDNGDVRTFMASDPAVVDLDRVQYVTGEGPIMDVLRDGVPRMAAASESRDRSPAFERACGDLDVGTALSAPLTIDGRTRGTLNVYTASDTCPTDGQLEATVMFAELLSSLIENAFASSAARRQLEQLTQALATRSVIEQAKGIIIASMSCTADEAFAVLSKQSQHENRKLHSIAADVVAGAIRRGAVSKGKASTS